MINITCNGEKRQAPPESRVIDFILGLDLDPETVVAELNGKILKRDEYESALIEEGAVLELIRFVGGG